jgi:hypothetical protein
MIMIMENPTIIQAKSNMCYGYFNKFWINLNKFTMMKMAKFLMNGDKLLWTSEFANN